MKIFLIGLPGSGKTTIGKELAKALTVPFVDLDAEVERQEQMTIKQIFDLRKEDYFRQSESTQLRKWCETPGDFVMATGGGTPVYFDNVQLINQSGKSIFLDVPPREIARRIQLTKVSDRPLFAKSDAEALKDQVEFLRSQRIHFYRQAHWIWTGTAISPEEILKMIRTESRS